MPLRIYGPDNSNNSDWRSPTEVRVYDNGSFRSVNVAYVYDTGTWKVVFPDPIIPNISVYSWGDSRNQANPALFDLSATFKTLNDDGTTLFAELFSGSSAVGTPIATQTVTPNNVSGPDNYFTATFTSSLYSSGTYCMRGTVKSITENSSSVTTVPLTVIYPTVSIQSYSVPNSTTFSVSWTSTNQNAWLVTIEDTSGNVVFASATAGPVNSPVYTIGTQTSYSGTISPPLLGSTNYILKVSVQSTNYKSDTASASFTSPAAQTSGITSYSTTGTCSTIKVDWTTNSSTQSGVVSLYLLVGEALGGSEEFISSFSFTTQRTHTFTSLQSNSPYKIYISNVNYQGQSGPTQEIYTGTLAPSANAPTNLTVTSDYWGKGASFTWTAATANCTTVSGYRLEYKLSTSSTWTNLSNSIASNAISFAIGSEFDSIFLPNRTYDFRLYAKTASYGEGPPASASLTMNNNPYAIQISGTNNIDTSSTSVLTAQLVNAQYENVSLSGFVVSWSFIAGLPPGAAGSSVSPTSSTTNSSGQATTTFSSGTSSGSGTVYADTSGISTFGGGQRVMTVTLRSGLIPSLTVSRNEYGANITHNNYNSLWSYSASVGSPGFIWSGSVNSSFFGIYIPTINTGTPSVSQDANYVYCTTGTWTFAPFVAVTVTSSRAGYQDVSMTLQAVGGTSSSVQPIGGFTQTYEYAWYYYDANNNEQLWGAGDPLLNGRRPKNTFYNNNIKGRTLYCKVTAYRTYSFSVGGNTVNSNKITGT